MALAFAGIAQQVMAVGPAVNTLPTGGKLVAGSATIAQSGNTMNINQSSQRAMINWNSFDVGSKATVNFNQPNAQAATLNYVNSASKSMINGAVNANGQVIFVNNNGIVFGKNAEVNVGGMVATTMNTSAKEFMDGKDIQTYEGGNSNGKIINKGNITANNINSYIALMAPQVINTGVIAATLSGNNAVALVAGQKVSLTFSDSQLVSVSVDASVVNALIKNKLLIQAGSGQVIIAANAAQDLMGSVIKNTGTISANGISTAGGKISLVAETVNQGGTISANSETTNAGQVVLSGNEVTLKSSSKTIATGVTAGGQILIGKTTQNTTQSKVNSRVVNIEQGALVDASANLNGHGGSIEVWSNNSTTVAGTFKAKGGVFSGNGGNIDASSAGKVTYGQGLIVDTTAPHGRTGNWKTDPLTITIDSTSAGILSNALNTTNVTLDATASSCGSLGTCSQSARAVISFLADVYSANTLTSLSLNVEGGTINVNSNITAGQVYAVAQAINVNGSINTNGGSNSNIYLAGAIINILGNINSNGNSQNNSNSSNLNSANTITGSNRRNGQNGLNADINTYTSNGGLINILATGDINISSNSYISSNGIHGGAISIVSTAGKTTINGIVDSIGKGLNNAGNGGNVVIVGKTQTDIIAALISSEGLSQGGVINLGQVNNLGNGTILAPPATAPPALSNFVNTVVASAVDSNNSITSSNINIDSQTGINAPNGSIVVFGDQIQINNSSITAANGTIVIGREGYSSGALAYLTVVSNSTLIADRVETSGDRLGTQAITVYANEWLLDPSTVAINATGPTTGGNLAAALATSSTIATTILTSDIVSAINAGTSVNIVANGAITQTSALNFTYNGVNAVSFTLDTKSGTAQDITVSAVTTQAGSGTINLNYYASGNLSLSSSITSTNGKLNILGQSFYANNTFAEQGNGSNVFAGIASNTVVNFTTRGGYIVLDGTGGTITGAGTPSIANTMGTIKNGVVWTNTNLKINTTNDGLAASAATTGGGNFILTSSRNSNDTNGYGTWEPGSGQTIDAGGYVLANLRSLGPTGLGYTVGGYAATSTISALGDISMSISGNPSGASSSIRVDSPFTSYAGAINLTSTLIGAPAGINIVGAIKAATGINLTASGGLGIGVTNTAAGTITTTGGVVNISASNSTTGYVVSLVGLVTGPQVSITSTNANATGKGISVTGGITISALNAGASNTYTSAGDALNITSTVGTAGTTGGISVTGGAITNNSNGGNVSFITNGDITATAAVSFATANTTNHSQTITYDTRTGNQTSQITTGTFTYNATGATQKVNYVDESNGSSLIVGATTISGYITVDNTCPSCTTSGVSDLTPASLAAKMTTTAGITVSGALSAGDYIYLNGLNNSASVNAVALGTSTLTVTSGSTATNAITVIGNHNTANVGAPGIASTGAIADQSTAGGNILFQSNGVISQTGAVTMAANTSGVAQTLTYDTTAGNNNSDITFGAAAAPITSAGASASSPVNVLIKSAGQITGEGAITATASGPLNVNMQTFDTAVGTATSKIAILLNGAITTRGGSVVLDGTGGTISGTTITPGSIGMGYVHTVAAIDTTSTAAGATITSASTGGNVSIAGSVNIAGVGGYQPSTTPIYAGGAVNIQTISTGAATYGYVVSANAGTSPIKAVGSVTMTETNTASSVTNATWISSAITSLTSSVSITSTTTTGTAITGAGAISGVTGVTITGTGNLGVSAGTAGAVTVSGVITNTGAGGVTVTSTGNTSVGAITDSGSGGISITGGRSVAAGTTTNGTITAVGTLTNTGGGVISLSMAQPTSSTGGVIESAAGITTANASTSSNVSYGNIGGVMGAVNAATVNSVNYRSLAQGIGVTLKASYTAPYGTAYNSVFATDWLQNPANATVTVSGVANFGAPLITAAQAQASLIFASAIGGNSNLVQTATNLDGTTNILSSLGKTVTTTGAGNTYNITPKVLTITGTQLSSTYNGVSTYATVANAGYTISGLVTNFNTGTVASPVTGAATGDAVSGVTHVVKLGASTMTNSAVAQACSTANCYTDAVSAALGTGLSNYTISYVSGTFNIAKVALSITQANTNLQFTGSAQTVTPAYSVSGLVGVDAVTSLTTNTQTGTNNGTYTGTISGANGTGLSNYTITYNPGTLTISSNQTITITALADAKVYGDAATTTNSLTYNSSGILSLTGLTLGNGTFTSCGCTIAGLTGGATISALTLTSLGGVTSAGVGAGAGTGGAYPITPSAASTSLSNIAWNYVPALLTVTPRSITIAATPITTTYGTSVSVPQTAPAGYAVSSGTVVTGDAISSVAVNYYNGSTYSTTVPGSKGAGTYTGVIIPSAATGTGGFNTTNYNITYTPTDLVVNKLAVTITANAQSTPYGTALALGTTAFTSSISSLPNGDTITGTTLQYNSSATVPGTTNATTYTNGIVASSASGTGGFGTSNYAITYAAGNLTVTPANVVITPVDLSAAGQSVVYNGATQTFNPTTGFTVTGLQNGQTPVFGTTGLASGLNVGTYANNITSAIIASLSSGSLSNYNITVGSQGSLTITPASLTVTGATTSLAYNGASQSNASPSVVGLVGIDLVAGNGVTVSGKSSGTNAGTYNDALSVAAAGATQLSNYSITKTNGALTITRLAATITGATTVNAYTSALQTNTYATSGILAGDLASASAISIGGVATATHVSQGTVPDVFAVTGTAANNYNFTYVPGSITLTPVALSVTGANTTAVYNKTTQTNSAATVSGLKGSDTATIGGSYGSGINVGVYTDALSVSLSNPSDYTVGVTNGSHTITPAIITLNGITAQNKVYDATTAATLNVGTITTSGVIAGDTVTLNTSTLSGAFADKNVGNAKTVLISGVVLAGASSSNYQLSGGANTTTTANITPAPLSIAGSNLTTTYNGSTQSLVAPTVTGLIAGDNVIASGNATGTNAGSYTATYTATGVDAGNYTITSNAPVLTINKASLVVTANNAAKIYGQADPTLTATVSGLQGSDTSSVISPAYTLTRAAGSDAGPYAITAAGPSAVTNYNITYTPAVFTIAQAGSLLINMNTATTTYGTGGTPTIASVQYVNGSGVLTNFTNTSGNIYTDGISTTITITPSITGATVTSNVGAYANAVTGAVTSGSTANYTAVTTIANTLNITPAPLALTVANVSKTYDATAVTAAQIIAGSLTGGVSSGVTVTSGSLMNSQTIAGLGGLTFSGSAIGAINASGSTYPLNASVGSGFSNYNVTITNGTLTVNTAPLVVNGAVTQATYNGALQTNAAASISGLKGSDSVVVTGYATGTHAGTTADSLLASGAAASNYSITYNNGSFTINPASLVVTGVANQYAYTGASQTNSGASVSGLKGSDTVAVSGYATATHVSQGIVSDTLSATLSNPADYSVTYVQGSLQITPIVITAAVNSATVMYNASSQTAGFTVTGLKGSDTATAASGTATGTNVGTYTSNLVLTTSSDYTVGSITNGTLNITPAPLTISAGLTANNKVYDTTNAATIAVTGNQTLAGVLGTDAVTVSSTGPYSGATFSQSNVGAGLTVTPGTSSTVINGVTYTTMAGVALTGAAAGNYYVTGVGSQTLTANITPAPLTINTGLTAANKVYDGTTAATITAATQTLSGVLTADAGNVAVSSSGPYTGTFSQSNVGNGLAVTASTTATTIAGGTYNAMTGATLSGSAAGNYYVTGTTSPITANITPYVINFGAGGTGPNISTVANNKVYDSTTTASGSLAMVNLFGTDSVWVSYSGATFANPNVANGIAVTFAGATLSGASAANYSIGNTPITAPANITPASLTITAVDKASFYTQALTTLTSAPAVGLLGSDTVTGATMTTTATTTGANSAVGAYPISISAATGSGLSNYSITYVPATYTIVGPGGLVISTGGVTTPYGTGTSGTLIAPAQPTASYTTGGSNISNLTFVSATPSGSAVSYVFVDATGHNVSFDLSPSNTSTSTSGNIVVGSYPYAASNLSAVSTGLTSAIPSGNFTVTPLAVTITAPASSTVYNGSIQNQSSPTVSPAILSTLTGTDQVNIAGSASGKNVGIYGSNLTVSGADSSNYAFTLINNNLTITPYILGSGGVGTPALSATANNKVYDTMTAATGAVAMTNIFAGDTVTAGYSSATFTGATGANVHNGTTVTFNGVTLAGPDAANYAVGTTPITATANITPAPLTISAGLTANNKVYDTTNAATIAVSGNQTLAGVLGTDAVTVSSTGSYTGATFSQSNVGAGLTVTPATSVVNGLTTMTGVTLTGAAAANYYVTGVGPQTLTANITPKPITISAGLTASNKVYDATTVASIAVSGSQTLSGVISSDVANVSVSSSGPYTGAFVQSNVGTGISVSPTTTGTVIAGATYNAMTGVTLGGSAAGNYYITGTSSTLAAAITPYIITAGATSGPRVLATADNKVYTSTTTANGTLAMVGLLGSDSVSISYSGATFASPNVANGITVTFSGAALSGASAANYSIAGATFTAPANITPAPLTVTANDQASLITQPLGSLSIASSIGLLGGQTVTGATLATVASTTGANASAGTYPITISTATGANGFTASNYSITYVPATYTILPAGQLLVSTSGMSSIYGSTVVSGNIVAPTVNPTLSYLTTGGAVISNLTYVSRTVSGNVVTYNYVDGSSHPVSFNLTPTGTSTSTSGNINVGSYTYAASNVSAPGTGLSATSGVATGDLVVTPLAVTITAPITGPLTYNGANQIQGAVNYSTPILSTGTGTDQVNISGLAAGKNVGIYGSNLAASGVDATNYKITLVNNNLTITPFIITPGSTTGPRITTAANDKVYNTTTAATGTLGMTGLFAGDSVAANYTSAAFASANVNLPSSPQTVTFSGVTLSGASAANYSIGAGAITAAANITPAPVTISGLVAQNKVYTSTTADVITGTPIVTGLLGTDTSTASGTAIGTFASPNVANGITVTANLSGMTLSNSNYVITGLTAPLSANITPAPLTISSGLVAQNKIYDTTTGATIAAVGTQTLSGVLGSDAINLAVSSSGPYTGTYSQANVGTSLAVTPTTTTTNINGLNYTTMAGVSLSGSAASNYYVTGPATTLTANITKASLTITANNQASFITQPAGALSYSSIGLLGSDTISAVTLVTAASNTQPAGQYAISASNATGAAITNYQVTYVPGVYTIVPAGQLLIQSSGAVTPYTTAATFANPTVAYATSGGAVINNLYLTASSTVNGITTYTYSDGAGASLHFNFAPTNPVMSGSNNVSVGTYGLSAANFAITGNNITNISPVVTGDLTVTPRIITVTAIPATYVYNGTVRVLANNALTAGIVTGDLVTVTDTTAGKNVGKYFSALATTGADARNYQTSFINANLTITPYVLGSGAGGPAISASANNRVYNTATSATGSLAMTGLFLGDVVTADYTSASFASPNANNGTIVTFNGITLFGAAAANYVLGSTPVTTTANITKAPVTISGLLAQNKVFDGTTAATITGNPVIAGLLGSDVSTLSGSVLAGLFASSNPADRILVKVILDALILGNPNYYIAGLTFPLAADITAPPQTINNMSVVQQVSTPPLPRVTPQEQRVTDNKGDILYVRDRDDLGSYFEVIPVPPSGSIKFPLPNQLLQNLIDSTGINSGAGNQGYKYLLLTDGATLNISAVDGTELPEGLTYNPASRSFSVNNLAQVKLPIAIKVSVIRNNRVVAEKILEVTK